MTNEKELFFIRVFPVVFKLGELAYRLFHW